MACCGGKKKITAISKMRYRAGLVVYFMLFSTLSAVMFLLSLFSRRLANVRAFQMMFFRDQLREIFLKEDITVVEPGGREKKEPARAATPSAG